MAFFRELRGKLSAKAPTANYNDIHDTSPCEPLERTHHKSLSIGSLWRTSRCPNSIVGGFFALPEETHPPAPALLQAQCNRASMSRAHLPPGGETMQEPLENQLIKASPGGSHPRLRRAASPMAWGQSGAVMALYHSGVLADIVIILGILGVFYGITQVGREWAGVLRPTVVIDLSFRALPRYTLFSLVRGLAAYCISCLLYTSDAADDLLCVVLGGRRIIKKKNNKKTYNI